MSSLRFTAAHSSGIRKRTKASKSPLHKRLQPSGSSSSSSRNPSPRKRSITEDEFRRLEETGLWSGGWILGADGDEPRDVPEAMRYASDHQFTPMPEDLRGLGLSREGIADILNYRKLLPPVVNVHHLHSLLPTLTATERELSRLTAEGTLRRIEVVGAGANLNWEGYITSQDYEDLVKSSGAVSEESKQSFLEFLREHPGSNKVVMAETKLSKENARELLSGGFLTFGKSFMQHEQLFRADGQHWNTSLQSLTATTAMRSTGLNNKPAGPDRSALGTITSVSSISRQADDIGKAVSSGDFSLSVPNLGTLIKLATDSRSHLLSLLGKSPFGEATEQLLRERWDGGVTKGNNKNKKSSTDGKGKFEGRTRKWNQFRGLTFEWVLGLVLGSGSVEGFWATGVGRGVRLVKGKR